MNRNDPTEGNLTDQKGTSTERVRRWRARHPERNAYLNRTGLRRRKATSPAGFLKALGLGHDEAQEMAASGDVAAELNQAAEAALETGGDDDGEK